MTRSTIVRLLVIAALLAMPARAELLSKQYEFKGNVVLEVGVENDEGLRLDSVTFSVPLAVDGKVRRTGGLVQAEVAISNTRAEALRAGVAIALFDEEGRLLGAANGGNKLGSIKPGRQKRFDLVFDGVNQEAHRAATFQITIETKP